MSYVRFLKYFISQSLLVALATYASSAKADGVRLGMPGYGGTGCPQGTVSAELSPDARRLTLILDGFQAEVGGATRKSVDMKNCALSVPVFVPAGYSVALERNLRIPYFAELPARASASIAVERFFAGSAGVTQRKNLVGPLSTEGTMDETLSDPAMIWSPCGRVVTLRSNINVTLRGNQSMDQALLSLFGSDPFTMNLQWKRCR